MEADDDALLRDSLDALEAMKRLVGDVASQTLPGDRPATFAAVVQAFALLRIARALEAIPVAIEKMVKQTGEGLASTLLQQRGTGTELDVDVLRREVQSCTTCLHPRGAHSSGFYGRGTGCNVRGCECQRYAETE